MVFAGKLRHSDLYEYDMGNSVPHYTPLIFLSEISLLLAVGAVELWAMRSVVQAPCGQPVALSIRPSNPSVYYLPAIRQYGKTAMQQNILAFWQLPCYCYGNSAMLFAVLLAMWQ